MPTFYFDIIQDGRLSTDTEGTGLDDLDAAIEEAVKTMAEVAADAIPGSRAMRMTIVIRRDGPILTQLDLDFSITDKRGLDVPPA